MTTEGWFASFVVVVVFAALVRGKHEPYLVMLAGVTVLLLSGVLNVSESLAGFSNPGLVTIGVLYVVAAGLRQTGTLAYFARRVLGRPSTTRQAQSRLALPVMVGSAFLNNTPLVAMLLPVVQDWCKVSSIPVSKLLLPLSYFAILGGVTTLIGTSTNLVVNGLLMDQGYPSLGMFGISAVGIPCAIAGYIYVLTFAGKLLPDLTPATTTEAAREYTVEMLVVAGPLVSKTIEAAGLAHIPGLRLVELHRPNPDRPSPSPVSARGSFPPQVPDEELWEDPPSDLQLQVNDRLAFIGTTELILDLLRTPGLAPATPKGEQLVGHPAGRYFAEAVVSRTSPLVGRTLREVGFCALYGAVVLGVSRNGTRLRTPLEYVDFRPGDALFLDAERAFIGSQKNRGDFSLVSRIEGEGPATSAQAPIATAIVLLMVLAAGVGWLSMLEAAALAAFAMLVTRCCSEELALSSINFPLLLTIGAAFGLGRALDKTGVAQTLADSLLSVAVGDPWAALALVFLTTAILTEFVTNSAASVIVFPIAFATAAQLGVNPIPFVVTVMIAASCSFATPFGYQTNLMVYAPGGYRFSDFPKIGIPLSLLLWGLTTLLAPLVYGF